MKTSRKREILVTIGVLLASVLIVGAAAAFKKTKTTAMTNTAATTTSDPATTSTTTTSSTYKDGTYKATGSYDSPGGTESITISVTLKDDVVTATSATSGANDDNAQEYQSAFIEGYKSLVIGKKINTISLSRVSGSSLTSQGFNNALTKIEAEAQA